MRLKDRISNARKVGEEKSQLSNTGVMRVYGKVNCLNMVRIAL